MVVNTSQFTLYSFMGEIRQLTYFFFSCHFFVLVEPGIAPAKSGAKRLLEVEFELTPMVSSSSITTSFTSSGTARRGWEVCDGALDSCDEVVWVSTSDS